MKALNTPDIPSPDANEYIYKILKLEEWATLTNAGEFKGSQDDLRDGFIHLSTQEQLQSTLDKYYTSAHTQGEDIVIAKVAVAGLVENLRYELARKTLYFPHLFVPLKRRDIAEFKTIKVDASGRYDAGFIMSEKA